MKVTNVSAETTLEHSTAAAQGDRSPRAAATGGVRITNGGATEVYPVRIINFIGAQVIDLDNAEVDIRIRGVGTGLPNETGATQPYGAVLVVDTNGDLVETTTAQDTRPVAIVQRSTSDTFAAPVVFSGYVAQINTTGTVNGGEFLETSSSAGLARSGGTTRRVGSFAQALHDGPDPDAIMWSPPDPVTGSGGGGVAPVDYVQITSPVSITATTEATANTIVTGSAVTYNGSTIAQVEFFCPYVTPSATAGRYVAIVLFEDGSAIGYMAVVRTPASAAMDIPVHVTRRFTPTAGAHTYSIRAHVNAGTGTVAAGAGGVATDAPAFLRIS